jgi:hypothetical protein
LSISIPALLPRYARGWKKPDRDASGLSEHLERVLSSTNPIENLFGRVREIGCHVRRWQNGTMVLRWSAAGVLGAERDFRKIAGFRGLPNLLAALRNHDTRTRPGFDATDKPLNWLCCSYQFQQRGGHRRSRIPPTA